MKITIEVHGQVLDITEDMIDPESVLLSLPMDHEETECQCEKRCKGVHRRLTGTGRIDLSAKLNGRPMWRDA